MVKRFELSYTKTAIILSLLLALLAKMAMSEKSAYRFHHKQSADVSASVSLNNDLNPSCSQHLQ